MKRRNFFQIAGLISLTLLAVLSFLACQNEPAITPPATLYNVTVTQAVGGGGTIDANPKSAEEDAVITLTAVPNTDYVLDGFTVTKDGGGNVALNTGSGNTRTFKMPAADVTVTASFTEDPDQGDEDIYTISIIQSLNGFFISDVSEAYEGDTVTLTADPESGYKLDSFTVTKEGGGTVATTATSDDNEYTFEMPADNVTVTVTFVKEQIGGPNPFEGKILIFQAYGTGTGGGAGASNTFVELYNIADEDIDLDGVFLWYADGTRPAVAGDPIADKDEPWKSIPLTGSIPAEGSYLIVGDDNNATSANFKFADYSLTGDINDATFNLSNRSFKVALIYGNVELDDDIQNPFDIDGQGTTVEGYIDMVGAANDPAATRPDQILGFETDHARNSASEAIRRKDLTDTDDNKNDFVAARYADMTDEVIEVRRPRNSTETASGWDPFEDPEEPEPGEGSKFFILQANSYGNNNDATLGSGFPKSLVELYNNTNATIDLTAGNYYLHIGNATTWTYQIKLAGSIPPQCSFLIVTNNSADFNTATPLRANLPTADQEADFLINNGAFKIAILKNQSTPLSVDNPFGDASFASDYVDMFGTGSNGFEGTVFPTANVSRPRVPRRISITDTDNNALDFSDVDYRGTASFPNSDLFKVWPRNSTMGAWDPITGLPQMDPTH